jgi:isoleucyl-tRNA synthetase
MHKSLGNVISPKEVIETYGADVLRLWVASEDYTKDLRFGKGILVQCADMYRKIRNTIRFMLANLYDFDKDKHSLPYDSLLPQDKWILHKFQGIIEEVTKAYENFDFHKVVNLLVNTLCINYLSSFYLDILKDRLYVLKSTDIRRKSAQFCLYYLLTELLKLIAPILSHTAEEAYKYLNTHEKEESIHLCDFPKVKPEYINPKIEKNFEFILSLREKIYVKLEDLRKSNKLGSSLEAKVKISVEDEEKFSILQEYKAYLPEIFIVSQVIILHDKQKLIEVDLAEGNKCQRCWMYSESVTETLPLCQRCQEIINSLSS